MVAMTDSRFVPNTAQRETVERDYSSPVVGWERKSGEYSNESAAIGGGFAGVATLESGVRVTVGRYGAVLSEERLEHMTVEMTPAMHDSARAIGETLVAMRKGTATVDDFRAVSRASRERHGDDLHEIVKAHALAGATGGRA
jgi:hypothetical protein